MPPRDDWRSLVERPPDRVITRPDGVAYMEHYWLGHGVRIHRILASDPQVDLHDHPWHYRSTILDGSYVEVSRAGEFEFVAGDELVRAATHPHRLILDAPVWTFFEHGPFLRRWGFHTADGWAYHRHYFARARDEVAT